MAITNTSKPSSPSFTNIARSATGETWATITTTWASETRTWDGVVSFFTNIARQATSITNISKPA